MQVIQIAGNVGKSTIRHTQENKPILNFSVAVSNGKDKDPTWYDCSLFGPRAESVKDYITKGTKIAVTGKPGFRVYDGKGYPEVLVNDFTLLGGGERQEGSSDADYSAGFSTGGGRKSAGSQESYDLNDDIPF